ncbi:hypothetical protein EVG20_g9267 [Dentipellis fragilis]|uniref:Fe2OG dioxygenase domain-containing protein n=1 Tax=Dentipellis fragilis TaxID=205917 RepID=A0A4Y9Y1Z0_9AGAM|nr:hypothetical protein EVG20_g9267 [Dentipellis fragilis]
MDTSPPPEAHRIPGPAAAYYIPNFVSIDEEAYLLRKIQETPHTKWRQLANRRLQTWGKLARSFKFYVREAFRRHHGGYGNDRVGVTLRPEPFGSSLSALRFLPNSKTQVALEIPRLLRDASGTGQPEPTYSATPGKFASPSVPQLIYPIHIGLVRGHGSVQALVAPVHIRHFCHEHFFTCGHLLYAKQVQLSLFIVEWTWCRPDLLTRLESTGAFVDSPHKRPNHIILNEYLPGQGIMPHEDGPSYHPVVATLSLGSHAVFHYYQYKPDAHALEDIDATEQSPSPTAAATGGAGRAINPTPVLSVLLEPRSLVITTSALYTGGLHGIDGVQTDIFAAPSLSSWGEEGDKTPESNGWVGVLIANAHMLAGEREREVVLRGGTLKRGARYSLTCRDVGRVSGLGPRSVLGWSR